MRVEQRESGLVVPRQKPKKPQREYGPFEIRSEEGREKAREAMRLLWCAMGLQEGGGIRLPGVTRDERRRLYRFFGESILGEDCPEFEQWC